MSDKLINNKELMKEWDYEKNIGYDPKELTCGSGKKVWWKCSFGHEYEMSPNQKINNNAKCPYCSNRRLLVGFNDFATTHPEIAKEWDYDKNSFKPNEVINANNQKVWWICNSGHSYLQTITSRKRGRGCPYCAYATHTSFPEQAINYYLKKAYSDILANDRHLQVELDIYIPSIKTAIEYDGYFAHKNKYIKDIKKNEICKNNNIRLIRIREDKLENLTDNNSINIICKQNNTKSLEESINKLADLLNLELDIDITRDEAKIKELYDNFRKDRNIVSVKPQLKFEWDYERNFPIIPENVYANTAHKYWWKCKKGHEWLASPNKRVSANRNCPYCANQLVESGLNDLETLYPELAKEWHPIKNGKLKPKDIYSKTNKKYWWLGKCGHEWKSAVSSRIKGIGCPICCNQKVKKGFNDLATTNPDILIDWDYNRNSILPSDITNGSGKKVWWICHKCGFSWSSSPSIRKKSGCPECGKKIKANKISKKVQQYSLDGKLLKEYTSLKNAEEETGIFKSNISRVCKGKLKSTGGFIWKYKE